MIRIFASRSKKKGIPLIDYQKKQHKLLVFGGITGILTLMLTALTFLFGDGVAAKWKSRSTPDDEDTSTYEIIDTNPDDSEADSEEKGNNTQGDLIRNIYDYDLGYINAYNTDSFSVKTSEIGLQYYTDTGIISYSSLYPKNLVKVGISLIDMFTNEIVQSLEGYMGDTIRFFGVSPGCYYFTVESEGYNDYYSEPFYIIQDGTNDIDPADWDIVIESSKKSYSAPFLIRLVDEMCNPIKNTFSEIMVMDPAGSYISSYTYSPVISNEEGYLCIEHTSGSHFIETVRFQLKEGYVLKISINHGEDTGVPFAEDGLSIVVYSAE